jgi:hypothetical protein
LTFVFALFSDAQGTSSLRIRDGRQGHANESSASRIRRRSRQHPAEAFVLGGPANGRLRRWPIPMAIGRERRGTHDRADANGPCRGCATGVSCWAAARVAGHAQCPVCTSVAQLVEVQRKLSQASKGAFPAGGQVRHLCDADCVLFALLSAVFVSDYPRLHIGCSNLKSRATSVTLQCYLGRPRTSRSPQLKCRIHPEHCYMLQAEAIRGCNLDQIACFYGNARTCHQRWRSTRKPAAACGTRAALMHSKGACSLHARRLAQIGWQRLPCA